MPCCGAQQQQMQLMLVLSAVVLALMPCSSLLGFRRAGWLQQHKQCSIIAPGERQCVGFVRLPES